MYDLVINPEDRFSHFMVHVVFVAEQAGLSPTQSHTSETDFISTSSKGFKSSNCVLNQEHSIIAFLIVRNV